MAPIRRHAGELHRRALHRRTATPLFQAPPRNPALRFSHFTPGRDLGRL